jgi:hypothetical protein
LLNSRTVLFINQRRKPTRISTGGQISACISALQKPSIPKRLPCLIVDSSAEGFRLMAACRLKRGQVVEIIPDEDPLNIFKCHVIWIGKPGSKQEGQVGLQLLNLTVNPRDA